MRKLAALLAITLPVVPLVFFATQGSSQPLTHLVSSTHRERPVQQVVPNQRELYALRQTAQIQATKYESLVKFESFVRTESFIAAIPKPQPAVHYYSAPTPVVSSTPPSTGGCGYPSSWAYPATPMTNECAWVCIGHHESGMTYTDNTGNGYTGSFQWAPGTWISAADGAGYSQYANGGRADLAPPAVQDAVAVYWQSVAGWGQWGTAGMCGV